VCRLLFCYRKTQKAACTQNKLVFFTASLYDRRAVSAYSLYFFKELKMKKLTLLAIVSLMALSACNTISGAGRDVSALGGAVSSGAENVQQKMSH
jgi:hypothetical protein